MTRPESEPDRRQSYLCAFDWPVHNACKGLIKLFRILVSLCQSKCKVHAALGRQLLIRQSLVSILLEISSRREAECFQVREAIVGLAIIWPQLDGTLVSLDAGRLVANRFQTHAPVRYGLRGAVDLILLHAGRIRRPHEAWRP